MPNAGVEKTAQHRHGTGSMGVIHTHMHYHTTKDAARDCMTFRHMHHADLEGTVNMVLSPRHVSRPKRPRHATLHKALARFLDWCGTQGIHIFNDTEATVTRYLAETMEEN
jgi:hypothetical protein